jgi:putative transposase
MIRCLHREQFQMTSGQRSHPYYRRGPRELAAVGRQLTTDDCSTPCSTCSGAASRGAPCPRSSALGRRFMTASRSGAGPASLKRSSGAACTSTKPGTASPLTGKRPTGPMSGRHWGGKDNGPNPTDRAKPGMKDHLLVDGRGVPLSILVTPANVNESPQLDELIEKMAIVRPRPTSRAPQHLALDAAFDNGPARAVLCAQHYIGHITPKGGRDGSRPRHPGAQARRWVVERTHAWHDRFRRLVVNWEKTTASRYAFLCLASALIAYRM